MACNNTPLDGHLGPDATPEENIITGLSLETKPDGSGEALKSVTVRLNEKLMIFGVRRDERGSFVENVEVSWVLTGGNGSLDILLGGKNARFTGKVVGDGAVKATALGYTREVAIEVVANPTPPEPLSLSASALGETSIQVDWQSGGGTTAGYIIAYRSGSWPPLTCDLGTIVPAQEITGTSHTITNLTAGTLYSFRVCSVNAEVPVDISRGVFVKQRTDEPAPPEIVGLTVGTVTDSSVALSWGSGGGTTADYRISYASGVVPPADCSSGTQVSEFAIDGTSHTITGLSSNTDYSFRVCAINNGSPIQASAGDTVTQTTLLPPPPNPTNFATSSIQTTQIGLSWTAAAGAAGYKISYFPGGTAPENCSTGHVIESADISGTSHTVTGLLGDRTYSFRLCSVDSQSPPVSSSGVTLTTQTEYNVPADPIMNVGRSSFVDDIGAESVNVFATIPLEEPAEGITVAYQSGATPPADCTSGTLDYVSFIRNSSDPKAQLYPLNPSTQYSARLCTHINGLYSPGVTVSWTTAASDPPPAPTNLTLVSNTSRRVELAWTSGGGSTTAYHVRSSTGGSFPNCPAYDPFFSPDTTVPTDTLSTSPNTTYWVRICSMNNVGEISSTGPTISFITPSDVGPPQVVGLTATPLDYETIELSWSSGGGDTKSYRMKYQSGSTAPADCSGGSYMSSPDPSTHATKVSNLDSTTDYSFRVCAASVTGEINSGVTVTTTTLDGPAPPPDPTSLTVTAADHASIALKWTSGGGTTSGFKIAFQSGGTAPADCSSGSTVASSLISGNQHLVTGLANNQQYSFRLCAENNDSPAEYSSGITGSATTGDPSGAPGEPTQLLAQGSSVSSVDLSWSDPGGTTGFMISYKKGSAAPGSCTSGSVITSDQISGTSHSVTGLEAGEEYSFRVCSIGPGPSSSSGITARGITYLSEQQPLVFSRAGGSSGKSGYVEVAGDIDQDGNMDMIYAYAYDSEATGLDFNLNTLWSLSANINSNSNVNPFVGDINNDGIKDLASLDHNGGTLSGAGLAEVYSGRDGSRIFHAEGKKSERLGVWARNMGDLDGDGFDDLAIAAEKSGPHPDGDEINANIYTFSSQSTHILASAQFTFVGEGPVGNMSAENLGDINQDGYDDLAVVFGVSGPDYYRVYSGADMALLHSESLIIYPNEIRSVSDLNGDNINDYFLLTITGSVERVEFRSGADHTLIRAYEENGMKLPVVLPDINSDGVADLLYLNPTFEGQQGGRTGVFWIESGADFTLLYSEEGLTDEELGQSGSSIGDYNGDGYDDICVSGKSNAVLYSGYDMRPMIELDKTITCGHSLGDMNGDGTDEFVDDGSTDLRILFGQQGF